MESRRWTPAPRDLIRRAGRARRTDDSPADDLVGYLWIWYLYDEGERPSRREVADELGWTEHRARKMLVRVSAERTEWRDVTGSGRPRDAEDRPTSAQERPPRPSNGAGLREPTARTSPDVAREAPPTRAQYTDTPTSTEQDQVLPSGSPARLSPNRPRLVESEEALGAPGSPGPLRTKAPTPRTTVDLDALFDRLEDTRLKRETNSRRAKLGGRRAQLRARVNEHGVEALELTWRWWHESDDDRARFLRDKFRYSTFLRASNCREYVELAADWDARDKAPPADLFDLGADAFDADGNLL